MKNNFNFQPRNSGPSKFRPSKFAYTVVHYFSNLSFMQKCINMQIVRDPDSWSRLKKLLKGHRDDQGECKSKDISDGRAQSHRNNGQESPSQGAELRPNPGTVPSFELEVLKAFARLDFRTGKNQWLECVFYSSFNMGFFFTMIILSFLALVY